MTVVVTSIDASVTTEIILSRVILVVKSPLYLDFHYLRILCEGFDTVDSK